MHHDTYVFEEEKLRWDSTASKLIQPLKKIFFWKKQTNQDAADVIWISLLSKTHCRTFPSQCSYRTIYKSGHWRRKSWSGTMAGFIRAGTIMHKSAQSGSIWSSLLCPQRSQRASADLTKLGWVRLGHFLCVLWILGISLISTQWATGPAHTGSLHCQGEDYIQNRQQQR